MSVFVRLGLSVLQAAFASKLAPTVQRLPPVQCGSELAREGALNNTQKLSITYVDIHHRRECLSLKNRQRRISLNPTQNPASEGRIMIIHLLTCLALTAVTLSVFSWYVLSEERTS
ncbi:hypothetical protein VD17_23525 [Pseudomonas fluorescens]|uniref:Uncharacterized protein n=2 Tax=Pseudomonas TaxID=286 RepID=A0A0F4V3J9_PSEFL|nr:hypothetical protein VD17_23525 [Pseudomonas fluorescens]